MAREPRSESSPAGLGVGLVEAAEPFEQSPRIGDVAGLVVRARAGDRDRLGIRAERVALGRIGGASFR